VPPALSLLLDLRASMVQAHVALGHFVPLEKSPKIAKCFGQQLAAPVTRKRRRELDATCALRNDPALDAHGGVSERGNTEAIRMAVAARITTRDSGG
jgi:hypothetical protein